MPRSLSNERGFCYLSVCDSYVEGLSNHSAGKSMDRKKLLELNRAAWNIQVLRGNRWTVPVDSAAIEKARLGRPEIVLTPNRMVPQTWFPPLDGCNTLMLASGGGQQSPIMAAAGARVTVADLSDKQLAQDRAVAEREGLSLTTVRCSMDDLSCFPDDSFELIIHPCSNSFVPDVTAVWNEASRVLRGGGRLLSGFTNPLMFLWDEQKLEGGELSVAYSLPYSDERSLPPERFQRLLDAQEPLMFGHTLSDQLGAQMQVGLALTDLYEDCWGDSASEAGYRVLDRFSASFVATRAEKLRA